MIRGLLGSMCGGVVKNATHIITAAHCISDGDSYPAKPRENMRIRVRAGGLRLDACDPINQQDREVKSLYVFCINYSNNACS